MILKKTAIAASVTVALAGVSLPASSAILGVAAEGLLVPVFVHDNGRFYDTVVRITTPASIGFDGIPNNFTAPNTTPTNAGPALFPAYAAYKPSVNEGGTKNYANINWYWFNYLSQKVIDGSRKVTPDDVEELWASDLIPTYYGEDGYLVVTTATPYNTGGKEGAPFSMFGEAAVIMSGCGSNSSDDEVAEACAEGEKRYDTVAIPVLGLTDGPDGGMTMPTKADNIKYSGVAGAPVVSPLVTGMRTSVSNGKKQANTVFDLALAQEGERAYHVIWLDQNRIDLADILLEACAPGSPGLIGGFIYDTEEKRNSWGGCLPFELNITKQKTDELGEIYPDVKLAGGGYIQYILPEYQDLADFGAPGPQTSGIAFSIVRVDGGDYVLSLANERGMFNDGCGNLDPDCANAKQ